LAARKTAGSRVRSASSARPLEGPDDTGGAVDGNARTPLAPLFDLKGQKARWRTDAVRIPAIAKVLKDLKGYKGKAEDVLSDMLNRWKLSTPSGCWHWGRFLAAFEFENSDQCKAKQVYAATLQNTRSHADAREGIEEAWKREADLEAVKDWSEAKVKEDKDIHLLQHEMVRSPLFSSRLHWFDGAISPHLPLEKEAFLCHHD